jgi:hypothetical protein
MPFPTQHAARLRDPGDFEDGSFVTLTEKFPDGVTAVAGKLDGEDSLTIQSIRFDIEEWTEAKAREWMEEHDDLGEVLEFEEATGEAEKAEDDDAPDAAGPASGEDRGLPIEVRDQYRKVPLQRLEEGDLLEAHERIHLLWGDRPADADENGYVNAHLEVLTVLAEKELEHPAAPPGTAELDEASVLATLSKTLTITHVWLSKADNRPDVIYMVVHEPFRVDGQGDWFDDRDVREAAHAWALQGFELNLEHDKIEGLVLEPGEAVVVENSTAAVPFIVDADGVERTFIAPELFPGDVPDEMKTHTEAGEGETLVTRGSWIIGVKAAGRVLEWFYDGKLTGPSLQGPASKVFDNRSDDLKKRYP